MMFNEVYPETKEVSYDQFQDYVESGGHIYDGSAIKQFIDAANGKLDYTYLSRQFERLEDSLGQELFLNMIVTGNKPFSDALFKNVEKILESDKSIKTPLDFEKMILNLIIYFLYIVLNSIQSIQFLISISKMKTNILKLSLT